MIIIIIGIILLIIGILLAIFALRKYYEISPEYNMERYLLRGIQLPVSKEIQRSLHIIQLLRVISAFSCAAGVVFIIAGIIWKLIEALCLYD